LVLQEKVVLEEGEVRKDDEVSVTEMDKNGDLKKGDVIQMDELNLEVVEEAAEEIAGREPKSPLEKAFKTTISFVLEVGISSSLVGRHWRTARGGRRWSSTNFQISFSSMEEDLNISRRDAAMGMKKEIMGRRARVRSKL
jgi:hypothetical protein